MEHCFGNCPCCLYPSSDYEFNFIQYHLNHQGYIILCILYIVSAVCSVHNKSTQYFIIRSLHGQTALWHHPLWLPLHPSSTSVVIIGSELYRATPSSKIEPPRENPPAHLRNASQRNAYLPPARSCIIVIQRDHTLANPIARAKILEHSSLRGRTRTRPRIKGRLLVWRAQHGRYRGAAAAQIS